ncbi:hypothetical protein [Marinoscillum furvescens]|nr:hypothetical protein [Marinoscillum furvescens]
MVTLLLSSCFEPPEFSEIPKIAFNSLRFIDYETERDSMVLSFDFEDGDGNIGLTENELFFPFHPFDYVIDARDSLVTFSDPDVEPPLYLVSSRVDPTKELLSETDNRPPYNCKDYQVSANDTLYIRKNPYHNNLHIDFLRKRSGEYEVIDFAETFGNTNCSEVDFNGRIPIFDVENLGRSLSGTINYTMFSIGFPIVLRRDTFKVRFFIYDRALNVSNTVESPDLTLQMITDERN